MQVNQNVDLNEQLSLLRKAAALEDKNSVIQFQLGDNNRVVSADVSKTDKIIGAGGKLFHPFHSRSQSDIEANNSTRDALVKLLVRLCDVEVAPGMREIDCLPLDIQAAMKKGDFDGKGHPLSSRRIGKIIEAYDNFKNRPVSNNGSVQGNKPVDVEHTSSPTVKVPPSPMNLSNPLDTLDDIKSLKTNIFDHLNQTSDGSQKTLEYTIKAYKKVVESLDEKKVSDDDKDTFIREFWEKREKYILMSTQNRVNNNNLVKGNSNRKPWLNNEDLKKEVRSLHCDYNDSGLTSLAKPSDIDELVKTELSYISKYANAAK